MREKYESLSLAALRDLAKSRGMKKISALRKAELIDAILAEDARAGMTTDGPAQQEKKQASKKQTREEPARGEDPAVPDSAAQETPADSGKRKSPRQAKKTSAEPSRKQGGDADAASADTGRKKKEESEPEPAETHRRNYRPLEEAKSRRKQGESGSRRKRTEAAEENKTRGKRAETSEENKGRGKRPEAAGENKGRGKRPEAADETNSRGRHAEDTDKGRNRGRHTEVSEDDRNHGRHTEPAEDSRTRGKRPVSFGENRSSRRHTDQTDENSFHRKYTEPSMQHTVREEAQSSAEQQQDKDGVHTRDHRDDQGGSSGSGQPRTEYARTEAEFDTGVKAHGILEVMADGYGFIRCENYLPGDNDVYVSPSLIRRFNLKTGDFITGNMRLRSQGEKFGALLFVSDVNGYTPFEAAKRTAFEDLTPIFPNERIRLETDASGISMRIMDLIAPVGKGQRGMIVSPPKAGKTTLLKDVARSVRINNPEMHLIILLIDERPEEVTDIKEAIESDNAEVIYSTFDELPEHHKRVSEMVIERAKRLVEHGQDVIILLDSITRLARAYNLVVPPSGRTLSGGLDPAALHMPKRFFGAARNMREGGSLTILATALVDTGSKMDDVVYEEFKGTGNMELILDRRLSEKRIFPAIDIVKSGTRREDLLLEPEEQEAVNMMRKGINGMKTEESVESILRLFVHTRNNQDFVNYLRKKRIFP
jgi:transcription termination factor Rho